MQICAAALRKNYFCWPAAKTMSDIVINISHSDEPAQERTPAGNQKRRNKRFRKRMRDFEHKGLMEGRHKYNHKMGHSRYDPPPHPNGASAKYPSLPTFTHNRSLPRPSSTAGASHCSSKPSTSSHSLPSFPASMNNRGSCEQLKGPMNTNPMTTTHRPSASSSQKPSTATASAGIPTKYLAIDCEMVGTGPKGSISQLARCSLVSYDGDVVYDKFINPSMPVTDYRTRWSGIRHRDLINAMPYSEARKEILRLLMGKVVVGHAIHNDFKVLGYSHPNALTRDTSRIPLLNQKAGFAVNECASLKRLTKAILNKDIQTGKKGHSSVEDAKATMELYRVVEQEWERKLAS
ncbi:interferon-stimulated 20 kDa exonuclease-like 2 [Centropristis striata]|uniref:interferon-stimulated 20 kDa exonuclease-like 2 n=1 Tax=Centropristis striata TaxID=184440 RepID=UPI0027DF2FB9|nr:interferon-stimulated 20 kDa exonuclease-like 2 [Centropristis striata]XP_059195795.1 interferon-stimulated 20 kDa exonuclease-like 2 [Centropristis striata]XP_059195796.1 interferon-stimulated 20 kDa exonuclease-like 2 [Centropristis striata]XP_059195797.1 interferon-stimulated 20 kDa exonuclease-like 2 [Centropristis striata]XP_059195798.1 interferon-stimulated 20 kDa exonuclease-like 2 [Centropristis striata]